MALVLNSWSNAASPPGSSPPLAFVPASQGAMEVVMSPEATQVDAANSPASTPAFVSAPPPPALAVGG